MLNINVGVFKKAKKSVEAKSVKILSLTFDKDTRFVFYNRLMHDSSLDIITGEKYSGAIVTTWKG